MAGSSFTRRVLWHDRLVIFGLLAVVLLSWTYLLAGAGMTREMGGMLMPMNMGPWTLGHGVLVFGMWAVMMIAMMLPSAAPTILLYGAVARRQDQGGALITASGGFVFGYVLVWTTFSLAAAALQFGLEQAALISPMMKTTSIAFAGAILVGVGLYQWVPLKQACLRRCRSPLEFIMEHWRPGVGGAVRMGFRHGVYCVGCCASLMLLLFVGGVMNLVWIGGVALFVLVEKLAPASHWISYGAGVLLVAWGVATLLSIA